MEVKPRIIIPININGNAIRVRLSNLYGKNNGLIEHTTIAICNENGEIDSESIQDVLFSRGLKAKLPSGENTVSDLIHFQTHPGMYLALSYFMHKCGTSGTLIGNTVKVIHSKEDYSSMNFSSDPVNPMFEKLSHQPPQAVVPYFCGLDVYTEDNPIVISCLGDSITAQNMWLVPLKKRIYAEFSGKVILLNHGISGNRLVNDGKGILGRMFGEAAIKRLPMELSEDSGVTHLLCALGVNDVGMSKIVKDGSMSAPTIEEFIKTYEKLIKEAKQQGSRVNAFTIYPAVLDKENARVKEFARLQINQEMKKLDFDKLIELDPILKNAKTSGYKEGYCTKDNLHLNKKGGQVLADSIEIDWIEKEVKKI